MKLVLSGPCAIQWSLHDDTLEFTGPDKGHTRMLTLKKWWLATSCKELKVLHKLSHSISNHLCERVEGDMAADLPSES